MLRTLRIVIVFLCSSACQTAAWSFFVAPHCEAPATDWFSLAWRWVRNVFCEPVPECNEQDMFLKKFFSLSTWQDESQSEQVLAELSTHTEVGLHGAKELIVEYIHKIFVDFVSLISMELKDKGIDVTPLVSFLDSDTWPSSSGLAKNTATPVVIVPGLSGACQGLLGQVAGFLKHYLNSEHVECIAEGESFLEQVGSSWFLGAGDAVEHFRQRVLSNPVYMERGFNVIAFSQGNFIARGYVQQFNGATIDGQVHPTVKSWISMNGPLLGQGGVPTVDHTEWWGSLLHSAAGLACGHAFLGSVVTPCGYLRVPGWLNRNRLVAKLNGEDLGLSPGQAELEAQETFLAQSKENFGRLESLVAVRNHGDTVIMPNEAQWFGTYGSGFHEVLSFRETAFYQQDTFGLKSLDTAGRLHFLETPGVRQHCIFSTSDLKAWVDEHWVAQVQLGDGRPEVAAVP
mmetsp:Transcript_161/g.338  ORF Transcript_161/g.338 Transcript_161/m.338 type:complete len:457 (+) Transcript_161:49-1419(+)